MEILEMSKISKYPFHGFDRVRSGPFGFATGRGCISDDENDSIYRERLHLRLHLLSCRVIASAMAGVPKSPQYRGVFDIHPVRS